MPLKRQSGLSCSGSEKHSGSGRPAAFGLLFNRIQVAAEVIAETFLDQCDRHAEASLNGEFVQKGGSLRQLPDLPGPLKATEIAFEHLETEQSIRLEFPQFQQHLGREPQTHQLLAADLLQTHRLAIAHHQLTRAEIWDELRQVGVVRQDIPQHLHRDRAAQLHGQAPCASRQTLHGLLDRLASGAGSAEPAREQSLKGGQRVSR